MKSVSELVIIFAVALTWLFVYQNYWGDIKTAIFANETTYVIHLSDVAMEVTVADDKEERIVGLSGVESLGEFGGKLFIYEEADYHSIWMKDMLMSIDVLWFDENMSLIHVENNLTPETYPNVFTPPSSARFILETNAYFVDSLKIQKGARLIVPPALLPKDIKGRLQQE